jgi:hypothetical protein
VAHRAHLLSGAVSMRTEGSIHMSRFHLASHLRDLDSIGVLLDPPHRTKYRNSFATAKCRLPLWRKDVRFGPAHCGGFLCNIRSRVRGCIIRLPAVSETLPSHSPRTRSADMGCSGATSSDRGLSKRQLSRLHRPASSNIDDPKLVRVHGSRDIPIAFKDHTRASGRSCLSRAMTSRPCPSVNRKSTTA